MAIDQECEAVVSSRGYNARQRHSCSGTFWVADDPDSLETKPTNEICDVFLFFNELSDNFAQHETADTAWPFTHQVFADTKHIRSVV